MEPQQLGNDLLPKIDRFDNHFLLSDEWIKTDLIKQAEKQWKELQDFEFKKMNVDSFFKEIEERFTRLLL